MASTSAPAPIDPRGPRTNQTVLATALVLGLVFQQQWVAPLFAVVLFLGAAFGPKYGPVLRFYAAVIKPRLGPPSELEDPRPPRFAASVGVVFLGAASLAFLLGADTVGWVLVTIVAVLAGISAVTGLCVGCEMYVWLVRLRGGVRVVKIDRELGEGARGRGPRGTRRRHPRRPHAARGAAAGRPPVRRSPVGGVQHRVLRGVPVGGGRDREPPPG